MGFESVLIICSIPLVFSVEFNGDLVFAIYLSCFRKD
jgi:hypothetical protein